MKKIAVLTYPVKHRKTYDVLSLLKANGYTDVNVYATPFHYQKAFFPIIQGQRIFPVGGDVDAGKIIERKIIDIYKADTFHSVAQRVYEHEVSMLVAAIGKSDDRHLKSVSVENYETHKRMPRNIEANLMEMFEQYKKSYTTESV